MTRKTKQRPRPEFWGDITAWCVDGTVPREALVECKQMAPVKEE